MTPAARSGAAAGFTIVELLVSIAIMAAVIGALFAMLHPARGAFHAQIEAADLHQRLRVAADAIAHDLRLAGAGVALGPDRGPLARALPPVLPHRIGRTGGETGVFRDGVVAALHVPHTAAQGTVRAPGGTGALTPSATIVSIAPRPSCAPGAPLCGFASGMRAILFDHRGAWDLVTADPAGGDLIAIAYDGTLAAAYPEGSSIAEVSARTYYLVADAGSGAFQLRRYDGYDSDVPVVDDVVGLAFRYFGDPEPPRILPGVMPSDPDAPSTTYGPRPPGVGHDDPDDLWGPGENCTFQVIDGAHAPRLPAIGGGDLVELDPAQLTDGPWCPDEIAPRRFDADLLRIRRVRVTIRVQASPAALRGPAGPLFAQGGTATSPNRFVPDMEVTFDVALRNR